MGIVEVALKKVEQQGTLLLKQIDSFKRRRLRAKFDVNFLMIILRSPQELGCVGCPQSAREAQRRMRTGE